MPGAWILFGLLASAGAITWVTGVLTARVGRPPVPPQQPLRAVAAALGWILVLFVGGVIAVRYTERVQPVALGCAATVLIAVLLSLARARLLRRTWTTRDRPGATRRGAMYYALFLGITLLVILLAAVPIVASDLFRMPYSPAWRTINRVMDRLNYTYNPPGGGETPSFPPWQNPGDAGLSYSDVTLTTADGVHLAGWFVPAPGASTSTVLLAHGLQDSKWTLLRLIPWLHDAGYNVMAPDLRGHGRSDKRPTTIGPEEALDIRAALDWLQAHGVGDSVVGLGQSLGAAALVNAAAPDGGLKGLILDSLFAEWKNVDYARNYGLPPEWLVPGVPDPVALIRRVHVPVLIIHGTADNLVHVDHALRLYQAANEPKEMWINDSGHAWSAWTYPELYRAKILRFLEDTLQVEGK